MWFLGPQEIKGGELAGRQYISRLTVSVLSSRHETDVDGGGGLSD